MVEVKIRREESLQGDIYLIPDLVWNQEEFMAELVLDTTGRDLQANAGLHSAITIALWTWRRVETYEMDQWSKDQKGWWGDSIPDDDNPVEPIGSKLHLLLRAPLSEDSEQLCETYIREAMQPLIDAGAIARVDVSATAYVAKGMLTFDMQCYAQSGALVYSQKYELLWKQEFANRR